MKKLIILSLSVIFLSSFKQEDKKRSDYPIMQPEANSVTLTDSFWLPKIQTVVKTTIPYAFRKCETEGRLENFITAGNVIAGGKGKALGYTFWDDSDIYKLIEGASYSLSSFPDTRLDNYLDSIIGIIKYGQEADGYLSTWRTIDPEYHPARKVQPGGKWSGLWISHELYNCGHLYEAAAAHYLVTGKRNLLDIALKNADLLVRVFGPEDNYDVPGHQEVELGLIKLYRITNNETYLNLARKFLDLRGDTVHRKATPEELVNRSYSQDHLPVVKQTEPVGHAVRAVYMYESMADIAVIYDDFLYRQAVETLWKNMVEKKMYITGGIGARHHRESFGDYYELPNLTAYCETCASIGSVLWNERMFRLTGESKYIDILERTLYNALIAGISTSGTEFFYSNPLEADTVFKFNQKAKDRSPWFGCSCCPTNLVRFIPVVPDLVYAVKDDNVYVNLFASGKASVLAGGKSVEIIQETQYPRNGTVNIDVMPEKTHRFTLNIRIPGWTGNGDATPGGLYRYLDRQVDAPKILLNGKPADYKMNKGYAEITRKWNKNDKITLLFPMKVRQVSTDERVVENNGLLSLEYGPLVYCAEEIDNKDIFNRLSIDTNAEYTVVNRTDLLGGINVIREKIGNDTFTFIPYYAWSNRGENRMKVWVNGK